MRGSMEDIIRKGFEIWRKNPDLALPFLFSTLSSIALAVILTFCFLLLFAAPLSLNMQELLAWASFAVGNRIIELLTVSILFYIIFLILNMMTSSFFYAGAIGMVRRSIDVGRATLGDMVDAGKRRFFDLLLNQVILSLLILLAAALFIGVSFGAFALTSAIGLPQQPLITLGVRLFTLAEMIMLLLFLMAPYFVVIGGLGAPAGLKQSYGFFMKNKGPVLLMYSFLYSFAGYYLHVSACAFLLASSVGLLLAPIPWSISSLASLPSLVAPVFTSLSITFAVAIAAAVLVMLAISVFITQPLGTIWLTLLYVRRVEEK